MTSKYKKEGRAMKEPEVRNTMHEHVMLFFKRLSEYCEKYSDHGETDYEEIRGHCKKCPLTGFCLTPPRFYEPNFVIVSLVLDILEPDSQGAE